MKEVAPSLVHDRYRRLKNAGVALAALVLASCSGDKQATPVNTDMAPSQTVEAVATPPKSKEMCNIVGLEDHYWEDEECMIGPSN